MDFKNVDECFLCSPWLQHFVKHVFVDVKACRYAKGIPRPLKPWQGAGETGACHVSLNYWPAPFCDLRHSQTTRKMKTNLPSAS